MFLKKKLLQNYKVKGEDIKMEDGRDLDELTELSYELRNVPVSKEKKKKKTKKNKKIKSLTKKTKKKKKMNMRIIQKKKRRR